MFFSCKTPIHTGLMSNALKWKHGTGSSSSLDVCSLSGAAERLCPCEGGESVDPADGNPLRLHEQLLHGLLQLVEGLVQVVIDDSQVKVVAVGPTDPGTLIHSLLQIIFLL